jgi:hypothetical protein
MNSISGKPVTTEEDAAEVIVEAERSLHRTKRSASDFIRDRSLLDAAPRQEGAEVLRAVPGLHIAVVRGWRHAARV